MAAPSDANSRAAKAPLPRCAWAGADPLMVAYHDDDWGVPSHDDRHLFEMQAIGVVDDHLTGCWRRGAACGS